MRVALLVSYDGTNLSGWQVQTNAQSVQYFLETAVFSAFSEKVRITGSGRTDAGVHAAGQVCSFDLQNSNVKPEKIADALNRRLPADIRVLKSAKADEKFDACRSAKNKTYRYSFYLDERQNPLKERYATQLKGHLDINLMKQAAKIIVGEHDFKAFCASGSSAKSTIREVLFVDIKEQESLGGKDLIIEVCGKGFLYNMVRIIAGTLAEIGLKKRDVLDIELAFETKNRSHLGKTAPAKGLTLLAVDYNYNLFY